MDACLSQRFLCIVLALGMYKCLNAQDVCAFTCNFDGEKYPVKDSCHNYYKCQKDINTREWTVLLRKCPNGYHYNSIYNTCISGPCENEETSTESGSPGSEYTSRTDRQTTSGEKLTTAGQGSTYLEGSSTLEQDITAEHDYTTPENRSTTTIFEETPSTTEHMYTSTSEGTTNVESSTVGEDTTSSTNTTEQGSTLGDDLSTTEDLEPSSTSPSPPFACKDSGYFPYEGSCFKYNYCYCYDFWGHTFCHHNVSHCPLGYYFCSKLNYCLPLWFMKWCECKET